MSGVWVGVRLFSLACISFAESYGVLAWDNGFWLDPRRPDYDPDPVRATSVPYFSDQCGETFRDFEEFEIALPALQEKLSKYRPRDFVVEALSMDESAKTYLKYYALAGEQSSRSG